MKKRLFSLILAAIIVVLTFSLAGCGSDTAEDWDYISKKGTLVIGITDFAPMNYYEEDGTLVGFDTEFAQAVCEKLGVTPEFKEIVWKSKEIELESKTIDCIWNGFTVDEYRQATFAFSDNYLVNRQVIVINKANAEVFTSLDSLKAASFVAEESSAGESVINDQALTTNYIPVDSQSRALLEVKAGTADAAVIDRIMAKYLVNTNTDYADLMVLDSADLTVASDEFYAIGFRLGSTETVTKVNEAVAALTADGTLAAIAEKYGIEDALVG